MVRCDGGHHHGTSPCAVTLYRDGGASIIWPIGEKDHICVRYNREGRFRDCHDGKGNPIAQEDAGLPPEAFDYLSSIMEFEASLLKDHGLDWVKYPRDTHKFENGRDGSILVQRRQDRRIDNPSKTASIIRPDNSAVLVLGGSVVGELDNQHHAKEVIRPCKVLPLLEIPQEETVENLEVEESLLPTF
jgi:hypothetical protein